MSATKGPLSIRLLIRVVVALTVAVLLASGLSWGLLWYRERPLAEAEQALDRGEPETTLEVTGVFLRAHPDNSRAIALRARALVATGAASEAIRLFDRIGPATADDLHAMARAYLIQQQWSRALPLLVRFLQLEPTSSGGLYEITACRVQLGMLREALDTARQFAALPGHEARGNVFLGTIHSDLGNHAEAVEAYGRVLEYEPRAADLQVSPQDFLIEFARTLLDAGRPADALSHLKNASATGATAEGLLLAGQALQSLGRMEEARGAWRTIVESDTGNLEAREALANASLLKGDAKAALAWLAPLVAVSDMRASTAYLFQRAHTIQGDNTAADRWSERAEELRADQKRQSAINTLILESPQSFWGIVVRAHRFASQANWGQAEALLNTLRRDQPADPFFHDLLKAVREQGPLPSLDQLPIQQF